jgi:hypothetical protein
MRAAWRTRIAVVGSLEEAQSFSATDPMIKAGRTVRKGNYQQKTA